MLQTGAKLGLLDTGASPAAKRLLESIAALESTDHIRIHPMTHPIEEGEPATPIVWAAPGDFYTLFAFWNCIWEALKEALDAYKDRCSSLKSWQRLDCGAKVSAELASAFEKCWDDHPGSRPKTKPKPPGIWRDSMDIYDLFEEALDSVRPPSNPEDEWPMWDGPSDRDPFWSGADQDLLEVHLFFQGLRKIEAAALGLETLLLGGTVAAPGVGATGVAGEAATVGEGAATGAAEGTATGAAEGAAEWAKALDELSKLAGKVLESIFR